MPQYGFVIDNRKCIGCHACSTACKAENEVPLGVHRTWVKYVEQGTFPDVRRHFQVTRCNHCASPPCVPICPTTAMFQRTDGIVEFDSDRCIGCKACMQACPYDAIHIDPETNTAAKCHYCAHRTEVGLEPACVVVCPEHAILAGDLDDPSSEIARALAAHPTRARKPEAGTRPKLFYIEAEEAAIVPGLARQDQGMLWAQWPGGGPYAKGAAGAGHASGAGADRARDARGAGNGVRHGASRDAGGVSDWRGPIEMDGTRRAAAMLGDTLGPRETYNVAHRIPWHWQVPAYLVTKAIGAGAFAYAAIALALGAPVEPLLTRVAPALALIMTAITTALLVLDLDRPERFLYILAKPQWKSWLVRGAVVLIAFSAVSAAFLASTWSMAPGDPLPALARALVVPGTLLAVLTAIYTAFLFAQCKGRDLWLSKGLSWSLLVEMVVAGCAGLLLCAPFTGIDVETADAVYFVFTLSSLMHGASIIGGARGRADPRSVAAATLARMRGGKYRVHTRIALGTSLAPLVQLSVMSLGVIGALERGGAWRLPWTEANIAWAALTGAAALVGLFAWSWAFVMAPQDLPNN